MPQTSVTIASASAAVAASSPVVLNWRGGRPVLWQVTVSSSLATGDFTVQYTLDDVQLTTYSTVYPPVGSPTVAPSVGAWTAVSSGFSPTSISGSSTANTPQHFTSSTIFPDGICGTFFAPPCALRLYSTNTSSGVLILKVVQGDGG